VTDSVAALIDFSRAFDEVNEERHLSEFNELGIHPRLAKWYGKAQTGFVRFANGVPQGSVSGPILVIIYTISLLKELKGLEQLGLQCAMFVDDLTIWHTNSDLPTSAAVIQKGLDGVTQWSEEFGMPLSRRKTEAIIFHNY
jgi:hypothetical protein